mgnify:CR=1 FL=1
MSKNYWQIKKQMEPLGCGGTIASKVAAWEARWAARCYSSGLPDSVPDGLLYSGRVPSWKAVALAVLRNDLHLKALGFAAPVVGPSSPGARFVLGEHQLELGLTNTKQEIGK